MNIFNLVKGRDMYIYILIRACTNTCVYIYSILYDMISLIVYVYVYMYTCTQSCVKFDGVFFFVISRAFLENYDRSFSRSPPPPPPLPSCPNPSCHPGAESIPLGSLANHTGRVRRRRESESNIMASRSLFKSHSDKISPALFRDDSDYGGGGTPGGLFSPSDGTEVGLVLRFYFHNF